NAYTRQGSDRSSGVMDPSMATSFAFPDSTGNDDMDPSPPLGPRPVGFGAAGDVIRSNLAGSLIGSTDGGNGDSGLELRIGSPSQGQQQIIGTPETRLL